ncbi:MAG TPA: rhomboid family intramembrane serine protease [Fimbriimonas sp.]|nr:rhomboid family intramembrane serine protease [Fimbriimonas sp.]
MSTGSRLPIVTLILIVANIAAAFALLVQPDLAYQFGFLPNLPRAAAAFTSMFLHANVLHLLGNMLFLAAVGAAVELATGSFRFAVVYFLSGLVGVAVHFLMMKSSPDPVPYIGASGAIAGCAAYYTIRYTSLKVPVAPHLALPVIGVTVLWLLLQVAGAFVRIGDAGGTAYWAHLGGFAAGVLLCFVFRSPDLGQVKIQHEVLNQMNARGPSASAIAAKRHLEKHPDDQKALWDLADAYDKLGEKQNEADTLLRLLDLVSVDQHVDVLRRLAAMGHVSRIPTIKRLQFADRCKSTAPFVARAMLRSVVEGPDDIQKPEAMLALAALDRETEPEKSQEILEALKREYPFHATVEVARKRGWLA